MKPLGTLKRVDLRSVWKNEAHHFTPWLADNIEALGEVLGMDLELTQREAGVGGFSLDLLATDLSANEVVVIENQFGDTDHSHLGQLLTYAAGFDAGSIVWIAESIRDEHRQALDWINQRTDMHTKVFGVVIELLQIDDSNPAYNFRLVVFPNEWGKGGITVSERGLKYREFFQPLIDELREEHHFTNARIAQPQNWHTFTSGVSGATYGTTFAQGDRFRVELYIDDGNGEENDELFEWLHESASKIEDELGEEVSWEPLESKRACRVAVYRPGSIEWGEDSLPGFREWGVQRLLKFKEVFGPRLLEWEAMPD